MNYQIDLQNREQLSLNSSELSDIKELYQQRNDSLDAFKQASLPSRKVEHWKYNDMTFLKEGEFELATQTRPMPTSYPAIAIEDAIELHFNNGVLANDLAALDLPQGLRIRKLQECSADKISLLAKMNQVNEKNMLLNLNQALCDNIIVIETLDNVQLNQMIYIKHLTSDLQNNAIASSQIFVMVGRSSELSILEQFESELTNAITLSLQQSFFQLSENSHVKHYRLNVEKDSAHQVGQVKATLEKDAVFDSFYLGLGSKLNRTDIDILHQGNNAHVELNGIYLPANEQRIDYHSNIEHQVPHCTSNEIFRGIIADKSSAVFNGKIHIFKDAQKSDAFLNNKNLLLTNQAEVNTKPELEIYADDVKCAHGATVAQLDDKSVYYLQTRGINKKRARKMLSIAFIQELVNKVKQDAVRKHLVSLLDDYMSHID
ncbi:Fe-S cluster assembly protein SufD [Aliikangiella sp. G2MR2-5]|uniref:Fe-S cluster assembly protein SufD n=1 Tax=Aliikangiella sp. G2MR2-5 TaxID=2788943 RepID=UPI0018AC4D0D|nr:Fe-S cluster assembly protein SufD [Aliikangiella sp. G2MR2-5]